MSYIAPNSDIVLCTNVPLDNSYDHTVTFANLSAQQAYFASKAYKTITQNSYQRAMKNSLRIACTMDEAVRCNYLYFRNISFENKYFYAFITGWEYVNNITTEITYEIDVFQTFAFDMHIQPCFVEREHPNTDVIGENLVPENLELGEYIVNGSGSLVPSTQEGVVTDNACVLFYCDFNDDSTCTPYTGGFANYVYSGLNVIKKETVNEITEFINRVTTNNKIEGIVAAYMCPFSPANPSRWQYYTWQINIQKQFVTMDGYVPRNKKLWTAPYFTGRIRCDSESADFPIEYFTGNNMSFDLVGIVLPEPVLSIIPTNFKKLGGGRRLDLRLTISQFPQVSFNVDVFKVYLAQNAASLPTKMITSVAQGASPIIGNMLMGNIAGAVGGGIQPAVSAASDIANTLAQLHDISTKPQQMNGTQTALNDYAIGAKTFYFDYMCIRSEFAMIIDDYFDMFGYATHRVKVPNRVGRPHWNYVKTKGMVLDVANAPQPYVQKLIDCFNKGITFWHNPSEVGNYSLDNRPV